MWISMANSVAWKWKYQLKVTPSYAYLYPISLRMGEKTDVITFVEREKGHKCACTHCTGVSGMSETGQIIAYIL